MPARDTPPSPRPAGILAGMRIRKKLIFLHTLFWLLLAITLVLALRPTISEIVRQAEAHEARLVLAIVISERAQAASDPSGTPISRAIATSLGQSVQIRVGSPAELGIDSATAAQLIADPAPITLSATNSSTPIVALYDIPSKTFLTASVFLQGARDAVVQLYILLIVTLLAVYALVAAALELLVLPRNVYMPIRRLLDADRAVQEGRKSAELIPESAIPADELGEIMRSRNRSVLALRKHESDLASALARFEDVADDLKRKNHLLEMARRNLADADRLASLGMMGAGIAHELNTPLAVIKGLAEKLHAGLAANEPAPISSDQAALMVRVVGRLERLSESLLDYARVRPPSSKDTDLRPLVDEAWTLVRLDPSAINIECINQLPKNLRAYCDGDRIMQVLVNILRNAANAIADAPIPPSSAGLIEVTGGVVNREGEPWVSVTITDNGPGISADLMSRLFQPFVTSRLDAHGTGLGLAVAEGILREHGGLIVARNKTEANQTRGAIFEIMLPERGPASEIPKN